MTSRGKIPSVAIRLGPATTGCGEALESFDALAPGQSLEVSLEGEPRELLLRLQAERKGMFEWSLLEAGPSSCRIHLTRRAAGRGASREVSEALAWDHDRLDALEREAFECLALGDEARARAAWSEFSVGLRRHIRFEEDLLFPTFEARLGVPREAGPTAVMRIEHRRIEGLIDSIGQAMSGEGEALSLRAGLHDVLGQHNAKEEAVLYPATDRALGPEERDDLVARFQAT
jgi:regulator of cell morphogenesis and NO signaling